MRRLTARLSIATVAGSALALLPATVWAQVADGLETADGGVGSFGFGDWLGLLVRLGLVLLIVWAAIRAMRWYSRRMSGGGGATRHLQVLETRSLAPNRSLHLVRLGGRAVLLGVTPERITSLLEIGDPAEVERLSLEPEMGGGGQHSMASIGRGLGNAFARLMPGSVGGDAREQRAEVQHAIARARGERPEALEARQ
ncbi:MAG: flagellar biosynthetic protein FliO [Dehalococcoidia bacterium]